MAVDFALFLSPDGIALAHRQSEGHWAFIGETSLDVPDLGHRLRTLREAGEARAAPGFPTLLILPDDQILYTDLQTDAMGGDLSAAVGRALDGRTPYALGELAYDFRNLSTGQVQVAAVAQQTLTEAVDFARSFGFNGVGFAATPPEAHFPGIPIFEIQPGFSPHDLPGSGMAFGPDTWASGLGVTDGPALTEEPAQVFVREAPLAAAEVPEVEIEAEELAPEPEIPVDEDPAMADDWRDSASEDDAPDLDDLDFVVPDEIATEPEPQDSGPLEAEDAPEAEVPEAEIPDAAATEPPIGPVEEQELSTEEASEPELKEEQTGPVDADGDAEPQDADGTQEADDGPTAETEDTEEIGDSQSEDVVEDVTSEYEPDPEAEIEPPVAEAQVPEAVDEPEPDVPGLAASMSDIDGQAASFLTEPPEEEETGEDESAEEETAEDVPQFTTHRRQDGDTSAPAPPALRRSGRLGLTLPGEDAPAPRLTASLNVTPEVPAAADPGPGAPDSGPTAEPKSESKSPKRRVPRTPALFAGGGQPHAEAAPALVDPVAMREPIAPVLTADTPEGPTPSLVQRLRNRRTEGSEPPADDTASFAFRRTPQLPGAGLSAELDDGVMTTGVLARRSSDTSARPSLRTALVLTVVLLLVLALIAVWSALFLPESRVAQFFGRVAPQVDSVAPDPLPEIEEDTAFVAPDAAEDIEAAITVPEPRPELDLPESVAADPVPEPPPAPVIEARVAPPSLEEAQEEYELYRIWQLAPDPPAVPTRDFLIPEPGERIVLAALDPVVPGLSATELAPPGAGPDPVEPPPPPPYSVLSNQLELTAATAEGTLTPQGAFVVAGRPDLDATPRPGTGPQESDLPAPAQTAAGGLTDAILAAFPPTPRPIEPSATEEPDGDEVTSPNGPRPAARPAALEASIETATEPGAAVASSALPQSRPAGIEAAAAASADRGPAGGASTASLVQPEAAVPAPTVEPDIPSNASVSRSATVESAINLREINLIGVRGAPGSRVALVRLASGRFVEVTVGDRLDGGQVAAIGADSLQYVRNGRNVTLQAPPG